MASRADCICAGLHCHVPFTSKVAAGTSAFLGHMLGAMHAVFCLLRRWLCLCMLPHMTWLLGTSGYIWVGRVGVWFGFVRSAQLLAVGTYIALSFEAMPGLCCFLRVTPWLLGTCTISISRSTRANRVWNLRPRGRVRNTAQPAPT